MVEEPVYLLAGSEQFLKEDALAKIKSSFLQDESGDFNFNTFYASSTPVKKILECACTSPFLGRKRVVLVRQIENLSASDGKLILSYVRTPHKHTCLVLETSEDNLKQTFFAEICKYARVIFCQSFTGSRLFAWIRACVEAKGKKIEEKAVRLLANNLNNNLQLLNSSLDNLILYIGEKETIEVGDVEVLVGRDVTTDVFELFDAVVARDNDESFQILDSLLKDGINSSQILGALAHKVISDRNRISPHTKNFGVRVDSTVFERALLDLRRTDSDIKQGKQTQRLALELLLARLLDLF